MILNTYLHGYTKHRNDMKTSHFAAAFFAVLSPFLSVGCSENDDSGSNRKAYTGPTVAEKLYYTVQLNDPNVLEVADLLVQYLKADGSIVQDTVRSSRWSKSVVFTPGKDVFFSLAAKYFAKDITSPSKSSYDFGLSLSSPLYYMNAKGDSLFAGSVKPRESDCSGIFKFPQTTLAAAEIQSGLWRKDIDSTMIYFNMNDTATQYKPYVWHEF